MHRMEKGEKVLRKLVNEMLSPYGVDFDFVLANPQIEGQDWYTYYKWQSVEQEDAFKFWAIQEIRKDFRMCKERAEREFAWFNLQYGLKSCRTNWT